MAKNTIDLIRETENNAISIENNAKINANQKIATAKSDAKSIIDDAVTTANQKAEDILKDAEAQTQIMINHFSD